MARLKTASTPLPLPPEPDLTCWPRNVTAQQGAQLVSHYFFPISPRTLRERWGLPWCLVNHKATTSTRGVLSAAQRRFDEAPISLMSVAFAIMTYLGAWNYLRGDDQVAEIAARFDRSYAPDASRPVKRGDDGWQPLIRIVTNSRVEADPESAATAA